MIFYVIPYNNDDFVSDKVNDSCKINVFSEIINNQNAPFNFEHSEGDFCIIKGKEHVLKTLSDFGVNLVSVKDLGKQDIDESCFRGTISAFDLKSKVDESTTDKSLNDATNRYQEKISKAMEDFNEENGK